MMEESSTAGTAPKQGAGLAGQRTPADQALASAQADKPGSSSPSSSGARPGGAQRRSGSDQTTTSPPPWRVEGVPTDDKRGKGGRRAWSRFWLTMFVLLLLNWAMSSLLLGTQTRTTVSYSFFLTQVTTGNVQSVTSTGNTIQGTFKHQVAYPPRAAQTQPVQQFTTERPTFANDNLFQKLQATGVTVNAESPNQGTPLWEDLLLWFGPALLMGGLLALVAQRAHERAHRHGWYGSVAGQTLRPLNREANDLRRRRRHR